RISSRTSSALRFAVHLWNSIVFASISLSLIEQGAYTLSSSGGEPHQMIVGSLGEAELLKISPLQNAKPIPLRVGNNFEPIR
ncbi:MAG TPA: hypothetical protein VJB59_09130, partial [Bdellovibrionota bacterium]|nr:hypothetical protein [Bdellovibrionota bacterium]